MHAELAQSLHELIRTDRNGKLRIFNPQTAPNIPKVSTIVHSMQFKVREVCFAVIAQMAGLATSIQIFVRFVLKILVVTLLPRS